MHDCVGLFEFLRNVELDHETRLFDDFLDNALDIFHGFVVCLVIDLVFLVVRQQVLFVLVLFLVGLLLDRKSVV